MVVALCVGIPLGCISAYNRGKWLDNVSEWIEIYSLAGLLTRFYSHSIVAGGLELMS